ncbi:hypothetical protein BKA69DRAFT_1046305 [Paraphysoderma sedebokerense]|nr:hypothetical protein BKA69DRAFT_1046305 [Paraphysoderma sedebokerense]
MGTADQGCVQNGPAANWRLADGSCVERGFRPGSWISTSVVNGLISGVRSYTALSRTLEGGMHVHPHANIGPTMANVLISPWDPLFWMHHCGVDYWWAQWEAAGNAGSYDGPSVSMGNFGHSDAVDYQNRLCYRYDSIRIQNPSSSSSANPSSTSATSPSTSSTQSSATPTGTVTNPQPETPTATPAPTSNQADIVVPDFSTIPDDILQSFNITRESVNQLDPVIKTVAAYLKHLKDQGKPLPTIETLKQFKLPKNIENAINAENPPPEEKSDAMGSDISLLCQSFWFTVIAILTFIL